MDNGIGSPSMKIFALCLVAAALSVNTAAVAQNYGPTDNHRYDRQDQYDRRDRDERRDDRYDDRSRGNNNVLPRQYMRERYIFNGWRERGLTHPTRGQEWVRVCDSFILVTTRTGRIQEVHMAGQGRVDNKPRWRLANSLRCGR